MQIPMEILSLIPRADSGAEMRQKTTTAAKTDNIFGKFLNESRAAMNTGKTTETTDDAGKLPADEEIETRPPKKPDKDSPPDETLAAGVMGYPNTVVFILEGDKESATTPEDTIDTLPIAEVSTIENAAPPAPPPADEPPDDSGYAEAEADAESAQQTATAGNTAQEAITAPDVQAAVEENTPAGMNKTAEADKAPASEAEDTGNEPEVTTGEVTARTPAIRTSEQRENEDEPDFSDSGDLSHLENENDKTHVKGHKEKTDSEADDTARNATAGAREQVNNIPIPLAEGIKPESFRADQQMRRAAEAPVRAENLFDEMVSRIETMQTGGLQTVSIQLKPEVLGKVALEIAMDAAGLHVKISAADSDVRGMINGQINALIESLENKGIEVVEVEVAYTGVDSGAFQEPHKDQAQPEHRRRSFRVDGIEDSAAYYAALTFDPLDYYIDAEISSVEYSA